MRTVHFTPPGPEAPHHSRKFRGSSRIGWLEADGPEALGKQGPDGSGDGLHLNRNSGIRPMLAGLSSPYAWVVRGATCARHKEACDEDEDPDIPEIAEHQARAVAGRRARGAGLCVRSVRPAAATATPTATATAAAADPAAGPFARAAGAALDSFAAAGPA